MTGRSPPQPAALIFAVPLLVLLVQGCAGFGARQGPSPPASSRETPHTFVYVGTGSGDLEVLELDPRVGDLTRRGKLTLGAHILSLAGPVTGRLLLATTNRSGAVVSLSVDPRQGTLRSLSRAGVGGTEPMGAAVDGSGRYVAVANHGSGNVSIVPIRQDGRLAPADTFAAGRGASAVGFHPSNTVAFVVNEGAGTISQYSFNPGTGALTPKPGQPLGLPRDAHPRQVRCHPNGRFVYVLHETAQTVSVHAFDDRMGTLTPMAFEVVSTLPEGTAPGKNRATGMRLHPEGRFLYVANRGHDSIAAFAVDAESGDLTLRGHVASGGQEPVELIVAPGGGFVVVANQKSRNLAVFRIAASGELEVAGALTLTAAPHTLHALQPALDDPEPSDPPQALLP